jgi:lambda family phage portal protein
MLRLNAWDRLIGFFSPVTAARNARVRHVLAEYEGGKNSRLRKAIKDERPPNMMVGQSAAKIRNYARHQERNHDIGRGILNVLVRNIVGPEGIQIEPMPLKRDGTVHTDFADQLMLLFWDWARRPEVSWTLDWAGVQRQACRSWLRDGDVFMQAVEGLNARLDHGTRVPLSLELLEADLVPLDFDDLSRNIRQGIECNDWGRPRAFHVYKNFPGEDFLSASSFQDLKRVPAERMLHLAHRDRLHQLRGVSIFASVVNRLEDLKDYEESERVAARIAAALTAVIKRNPENDVTSPGTSEQGRPLLKIEAGTVFDGAGAGDEITMVDSNRPNAGLEGFRNGQLRAVAAGVSGSYSSVSKNYDGTYSAQRQELVEQWPEYRCLTGSFVAGCAQPVWERFVGLAILSGLRIPADVDPTTLMAAQYIGPPMPWIDPLKEAQANRLLVRSCFKSATAVVRERGGDPWGTFQQISDERANWGELGLVSETNPADDKPAAGAAPPAEDPPPEDPDDPENPPKPAPAAKRNGARHAS